MTRTTTTTTTTTTTIPTPLPDDRGPWRALVTSIAFGTAIAVILTYNVREIPPRVPGEISVANRLAEVLVTVCGHSVAWAVLLCVQELLHPGTTLSVAIDVSQCAKCRRALRWHDEVWCVWCAARTCVPCAMATPECHRCLCPQGLRPSRLSCHALRLLRIVWLPVIGGSGVTSLGWLVWLVVDCVAVASSSTTSVWHAEAPCRVGVETIGGLTVMHSVALVLSVPVLWPSQSRQFVRAHGFSLALSYRHAFPSVLGSVALAFIATVGASLRVALGVTAVYAMLNCSGACWCVYQVWWECRHRARMLRLRARTHDDAWPVDMENVAAVRIRDAVGNRLCMRQ